MLFGSSLCTVISSHPPSSALNHSGNNTPPWQEHLLKWSLSRERLFLNSSGQEQIAPFPDGRAGWLWLCILLAVWVKFRNSCLFRISSLDPQDRGTQATSPGELHCFSGEEKSSSAEQHPWWPMPATALTSVSLKASCPGSQRPC